MHAQALTHSERARDTHAHAHINAWVSIEFMDDGFATRKLSQPFRQRLFSIQIRNDVNTLELIGRSVVAIYLFFFILNFLLSKS